jgi:hypothetical protein
MAATFAWPGPNLYYVESKVNRTSLQLLVYQDYQQLSSVYLYGYDNPSTWHSSHQRERTSFDNEPSGDGTAHSFDKSEDPCSSNVAQKSVVLWLRG